MNEEDDTWRKMAEQGTLEEALEIARSVKEWIGYVDTRPDRRKVLYSGISSKGNMVQIERECGYNVFNQKYVFSLWIVPQGYESYLGEVSVQQKKGEEVAIRELFEKVDAKNYRQTLVSNDGVEVYP